MATDLAPVYLDDTRVTLQGDPRPKVSKILQAGGRPANARVRVEGPGDRVLGPDEIIDRTGTQQPVHLRTAQQQTTAGSSGDESIGGPGRQGNVQVPGEILRGEARPSTPSKGPASNPPATQRFAESQSFADPVHKGGSPRSATAPGARPSRPAPTAPRGRIPAPPASSTPSSSESLDRVSEEE